MLITPTRRPRPAPIASGYVASATGVDFNSVADTALVLKMPAGYTRFIVNALRIAGASGTITTATFGVFTDISAGGTAIVNGGTVVTVSTASDATNNNAESAASNNANTQAYVAASLPTPNTVYFRITNAQGSAATASVEFLYTILP